MISGRPVYFSGCKINHAYSRLAINTKPLLQHTGDKLVTNIIRHKKKPNAITSGFYNMFFDGL